MKNVGQRLFIAFYAEKKYDYNNAITSYKSKKYSQKISSYLKNERSLCFAKINVVNKNDQLEKQ